MADGGTGATAAVKAGEHEVWALWRAYKRLFRTLTLPLSTLFTPGAWGWLGNDVVSGLRKNPSTKRALDLLAPLPDPLFDKLSALASVNLRRQEQGFQVLAIFYVSVPLTAALLFGEIAPGEVLSLLRDETRAVLQLVVMLGGATVLYMAALWRARQMVHVIDLARIERGQSPFTALELRETS